MHDRVIWPEKYGPKTSAIYAPNDIHSHSIVPGGFEVTS